MSEMKVNGTPVQLSSKALCQCPAPEIPFSRTNPPCKMICRRMWNRWRSTKQTPQSSVFCLENKNYVGNRAQVSVVCAFFPKFPLLCVLCYVYLHLVFLLRYICKICPSQIRLLWALKMEKLFINMQSLKELWWSVVNSYFACCFWQEQMWKIRACAWMNILSTSMVTWSSKLSNEANSWNDSGANNSMLVTIAKQMHILVSIPTFERC